MRGDGNTHLYSALGSKQSVDGGMRTPDELAHGTFAVIGGAYHAYKLAKHAQYGA